MALTLKQRSWLCRQNTVLLWLCVLVCCFTFYWLTYLGHLSYPDEKVKNQQNVVEENFSHNATWRNTPNYLKHGDSSVAYNEKVKNLSRMSNSYTHDAAQRNIRLSTTPVPLPKLGRGKSNISTTKHLYPRKYITVNIIGRLGNEMFQFASLLGIARKNNLTPLVSRSLGLRQIFNMSVDSIEDHGNVWFKSTYKEANGGCTFDPKVLQFGNLVNIRLDGYFQSWRYFNDASTELRQSLSFNTELKNKAYVEFSNMVLPYKKRVTGEITYIAVHVRRGDMVTSQEFINYGYIVAPLEYLQKGMSRFRKTFKNCLFLVASNGLDWCKENIKDADVLFLSPGNSPELDMAILTNCNHTLMTVGSFGWWTAWLVNGQTIYFNGYPKPGSELDKEFKSSDYRPPDWIGLD